MFLPAGQTPLSLLVKQPSHLHVSAVPLSQPFHWQGPRTSAEWHTAAALACRTPFPAFWWSLQFLLPSSKVEPCVLRAALVAEVLRTILSGTSTKSGARQYLSLANIQKNPFFCHSIPARNHVLGFPLVSDESCACPYSWPQAQPAAWHTWPHSRGAGCAWGQLECRAVVRCSEQTGWLLLEEPSSIPCASCHSADVGLHLYRWG